MPAPASSRLLLPAVVVVAPTTAAAAESHAGDGRRSRPAADAVAVALGFVVQVFGAQQTLFRVDVASLAGLGAPVAR